METIGTRLLPGAPLRNHLLRQIPAALVALASPPQLVIVQVGNHPASTVYVRHKQAACAKVGLNCVLEQVAEAAGEHALHRLLRGLAQAPDVTGILLQLPLPVGWDVVTALGMIPALKDVDGLCPENQQHRRIWPATPVGVLRLLHWAKVPLVGTQAVVVGRSILVGKPMALMLLEANATVTVAHSRTPDLSALMRQADILVAAVGRPGMVTAADIKPGSVVIDVGINRVELPDGSARLVGDVDFASVEPVAGAITPVPGGVGPMTVAMLLENTVTSYRSRL
jgi:methylenetetrahydrofolate dehydrogenase (NADP+)/methenyltetrahydrofolate cyclohydrolase